MELDSLSEAIERAKTQRNRLIMVTDNSSLNLSSLSTVINVNEKLSEQLIDVPKQDRAGRAGKLFEELVNGTIGDTLVVKNIHILFDRSLGVDPLKLLEESAKKKTLVVFWPGEINSSALTYAEANHPEYKKYKMSDLKDVIFINANGVKE